MGRQYRSARVTGPGGDNFREFVNPAPSTAVTAGNPFDIPGYGVTDISTWGASTYYMAPPVQGAVKTLISHSSAPAARTVRLSTGASVTVLWSGKTTGASGNTEFSFAASTLDTCVVLVGLNSTHWVLQSIYPALNSTGTAILST
jgi:hypothetical protein